MFMFHAYQAAVTHEEEQITVAKQQLVTTSHLSLFVREQNKEQRDKQIETKEQCM